MLAKLISIVRHPADAWNYLVATTGLGVVLKGLLDANTVQVWSGVFVAVAAVFWGFIRDQKRHDRVERRADDWESWALAYRKRKIEETGVDPFKDGIPPFMPFEETKEPASG